MTHAQYPDFPLAEYERRFANLRVAMERHGLDAILITNRANHRYFSGFYAEVFELPHYYFFAILPRDASRQPVFLCTDAFPVAATSWIADKRGWSWPKNMYASKESPGVNLLAAVLREIGLGEATIGMELASDMHVHMGVSHVLQLRDALPGARWADASDAIMEVRAVKSAAEIDRLRRAARISAEAVRFGFASLVPGMTEMELTRRMAARCYELGATDIRFMINYAGPRRMWADATPTSYAIQQGDLVQFDGGCLVDGYWCDFKRMASVGPPDPAGLRDYEIAREAIEEATALLRPGAMPSDIVRAAWEVIRRNGYGDFVTWCRDAGWQAIGHGVGLDVHERPGLALHNDAPLEAGMVLSIEPFVSLGGVTPFHLAAGKFGLEDSVLITEDGHEILTSESIISHELFVI
ncbi:MAG: aminopeptidase P family protein [Thermomicrobiales bacterium]|nr:aminopeptidase P family protein [Thermomicrobiales bacterium]